MFPRNVLDRVVQYPRRYKFALVSGTSDTYDLIPVPGIIAEEGTPINKGYLQPIEQTLLELQLLNAGYVGRSVTLDWTAEKLVNCQKFWSGQNGTRNVIKQISYAWNAQKLVESEVYLFHDYDENNQLIETRQFNVAYTWNADKLCTMIDIQEVV